MGKTKALENKQLQREAKTNNGVLKLSDFKKDSLNWHRLGEPGGSDINVNVFHSDLVDFLKKGE